MLGERYRFQDSSLPWFQSAPSSSCQVTSWNEVQYFTATQMCRFCDGFVLICILRSKVYAVYAASASFRLSWRHPKFLYSLILLCFDCHPYRVSVNEERLLHFPDLGTANPLTQLVALNWTACQGGLFSSMSTRVWADLAVIGYCDVSWKSGFDLALIDFARIHAANI